MEPKHRKTLLTALIDRVSRIMTCSGTANRTGFEAFLYGLSRCYAGGIRFRGALYRRRIFHARSLPCPVVSVGNLAVGGTGKTPTTVYLARRLDRWGYKVVVISRGYHGKAEKHGGVVSDGKRLLMGPESAGDEPVLMAVSLNTPVVVGSNRFAAGALALDRFAPDVLLLDDGFQHIQLDRDINLVLLDGRFPLGNTHLLPRGILREPVSALGRADAFILTRCGPAFRGTDAQSKPPLQALGDGRPVFCSDHLPYCYIVKRGCRTVLNPCSPPSDPDSGQCLKERRVFGFSGLARNRDFQRTVAGFHCRTVGFLEFPDHHAYSQNDLRSIRSRALAAGAEYLVTTEKDFVRIAHDITWPLDMVVVGVKISFGPDTAAFDDFIQRKLAALVH